MSNLKDNTKDWVDLDLKDFTFYITDGLDLPYMVVCKETQFCIEVKSKKQAIQLKRNPEFIWYDERYLFENGLI